jgi:hypothetical protein
LLVYKAFLLGRKNPLLIYKAFLLGSKDLLLVYKNALQVSKKPWIGSKSRNLTSFETAPVEKRQITQLLDWPESAIRRELHVERGYIDYNERNRKSQNLLLQ